MIEPKTVLQRKANKVYSPDLKIDKLVILVEDDIINQTTITKFVKQKYNILVTDSYEGVVELLDMNKVDLILMDISLQSDKNGLEITKELRSQEKFADIPIIATTAHAFERDRNTMLAAGCTDYLAKPFTREHLLNKIDEYLL